MQTLRMRCEMDKCFSSCILVADRCGMLCGIHTWLEFGLASSHPDVPDMAATSSQHISCRLYRADTIIVSSTDSTTNDIHAYLHNNNYT